MSQTFILLLSIFISFLLWIVILAILVFIKNKEYYGHKKERLDKQSSHIVTVLEAHHKISKQMEVLEKLDGNIQKEKAEWFHKATTSKPVE